MVFSIASQYDRRRCTFNTKPEKDKDISPNNLLDFQSDQASFFVSLGSFFSSSSPICDEKTLMGNFLSVHPFFTYTSLTLIQAVVLFLFSTWIKLLRLFLFHTGTAHDWEEHLRYSIPVSGIAGSCYYSQLCYVKLLIKTLQPVSQSIKLLFLQNSGFRSLVVRNLHIFQLIHSPWKTHVYVLVY